MNSEENEDQRLPDGWVLCQSKSNPGRRYFFNTRTGKSSWTQPQAEDEYDQKKQKGKKEKPNFREIKKRLEYQMKYLKRKSDGDEDSLSNKKQRPESTPEAISPFSPTKPPTPARYTEPKPIDKEPCLKPILTKNSANARLSQLRARLSSEAQASQEVQPPTENLRTIGMAAPFTEQRYVRFDLKSPPLNEFKCTTRTPRSDGLSPSSSQFLAANKIISSMKAHLPDQFRNMKPKDTFADIEEGICNQTAEYPFMKHPATPPQFSEASKLVSAIKSKLSYTPMDDRARSFMSNKEYVEKIKSFIAAKEQVFRKEKLSNPYLTQDQINHNNHETRAFMQQKNYSGNREVQINSFVSNKEAINCRNDKPVTCTSNIRPTDPRQDKLRAFISNVRHLNDMENIKQSTRIPTQEHINFSEYKARNCMPNRTNTTQSNRVEATVKTNVPIIQNTEDCQKTQIASTSIGDNGRTTIPNIKSFEHNVITQAPSTHSMASDIKNKITNRPIPNQINMEGERQTPTINKLIVDNNLRVPVVRIPISDRLKVDLKQGICTTNRPNMEDTRTFTSNKEQQENKSGITKPSPAEENVKMFTQTRPQIADELRPATHVIEKTEEKVRNHLSNEDKTENKLNSSKTSQQTMSDPLVNNMIHAHEADLNLTNQSTIQIEKVLESNTSSDEESDEEDESIEMPIEENIMTSIEEQLEKMDQKSPQNQNIVNHRKEDSLEPILKSTFTARNQTPTFESNIDIESPSTQNLDALTEEAPVIEPTKVTKFMSDESIVSLLSDESSSSESEKETEDKSEDEIVTYSSAKDRMDSLRNRLSKEAEITEMPEITDIEFLNSIKLPSPNVITDEEYLNMIELPKYPSEAMEVDCKEDLESTSYSCPKNVMDPDADIVLVVDTNIFIHELDVIKNVLNSHIKGYTRQPTLLVPWRVINELDRLKDNNNGNGAICTRARAAMDYLYKSLPENDRIKGQSLRDSNSHIYPCESPDDEILNCCLQQAERGKSVILLSNDKNLCNKAAVNAVRCIELDELRPLLQSTPRPSADPDLCAGVKHCEAAMYALLANILENEMRAKYNNLWQHVIFKAPPWSLTDVLHCLLKHWIAVFNEVFPRIEHLLTDLKNTVVCIENKDPKSLTQSEVANFKELCLEIAKKCLIIPEYMGLAKATLERLHRKPNEEAPEMAVIEAFEQLWTVFSSYCAQLCSAVGLECSLEDKLGGACTARQLGERWQVYSAQLYALTLAIKGALCTDKEELTEEQVDDLEDVFKECCALVEADGSKVNKENIRVFCTKCRNMLQEASAKFCGLTELLTVCKQRMETM